MAVEVNEYGSYKIRTKVGSIRGNMSRNQMESLGFSDIPWSEGSLREVVSKVSLVVGQAFSNAIARNERESPGGANVEEM